MGKPSGIASVWNRTRQTALAGRASVADTSKARRTGLLQRESLAAGEGLWLVPCEAVHSFGMKFAIDVLYLDKQKRVLKIRRAMQPRRLSACLWAYSALELPAGTAEATGTEPGDTLEIRRLTPDDEGARS
jgi:hypothetical protein